MVVTSTLSPPAAPRGLEPRGVSSDVKSLRDSFCQKSISAAQRAMDRLRANLGQPEAQERTSFYLWQALETCYHYAQAWRVVVDCVLEAHSEMLRTGRWAQWTEYLKMALAASRRLGDARAEMTLLLYLGRMQEMRGEWTTARALLEQALALANEAEDRNARGWALTTLANIEWQGGRIDEAKRQITLALEALEGTGDAKGLSEAYRALGNIDSQRGQEDEALAAYANALEYAQACGDLHCLASVYHNVGTICAQRGESRGARAQYHHALELFKKTGDQAGEAMATANIGLACQVDLGYWRPALETFRQALALSQKAGYYRGEATALSYLADALLKLGELEQAWIAIEQLRAVYTRTNNAFDLLTLERLMGTAYLAQGDAKSALRHLRRARQSPELAEDPEELAYAETELGRAYTMLKAWKKAAAAFERALAQWTLITEKPGELETRLSQVELYQQMRDWDRLAQALKPAQFLARKIKREDALALLDAARGDAHLAAGKIDQGRRAYELALRRLSRRAENDRQAQRYQRIVAQMQAQADELEHAGQAAAAAALRAIARNA